MKLVSLNIWGGKAHEALFSFIAEHSPSTDIFSFQEVWTSPRADIEESRNTHVHILEELKAFLPDFSAHFFPVQDGMDLESAVDFELTQGNAIFVRNTLPVSSEGQVFTYGARDSSTSDTWEDVPTCFGFVRVPHGAGELTVMNFHGKAVPGDKLDTPERLEQSRRIAAFVAEEKGEVILAGDFNLLPETESIRIVEEAGLKNLITDFDIKTTRSRLSAYYGKPDEQKFADFAFVSKGVTVNNFAVPAECVASDHLPMILEFK